MPEPAGYGRRPCQSHPWDSQRKPRTVSRSSCRNLLGRDWETLRILLVSRRTTDAFNKVVAISWSSMLLVPGHNVGPYEIIALIGEGGMGEVYKARDMRLDRTVAIKASKQQFSERFEREARAVAALNHPHICHLYDVGT